MLIIMWYTVYCFTKVPPKCRWTEQHSGNNRIYFQWMHSGIEKKRTCRFKRRDILNCHGNLDRAFQGIIESMLMKKKAQALLFPGFPDQIFGNHTASKVNMASKCSHWCFSSQNPTICSYSETTLLFPKTSLRPCWLLTNRFLSIFFLQSYIQFRSIMVCTT